MSKLIILAEILMKELEHLSPKLTICETGSIYVKLIGKIKQIRIANHKGRKTSRNCWELRSDAMTTRKNLTRIYNINSLYQLISDLK